MTIKFYNRKKELKLLEKVKKPYLAVIYGRRRIGKTSLVLNFVKNKDYIYFFVNPKKSEKLLLQEFSSKLGEKLKIPYISVANWEEFFDMLFRYKGIVIFDEFQKFLEINPEVPFILQKFWDTKKEKPTIIITGSVVGMIRELFEKSESPLFKRAEILIHLKELDISTVFEILSDLGVKNLEEKFKFYLLFGGVPYYYSLLFKYGIVDVESAIKTLVLDEFGPLKKEVEEVMIEAFKKEYSTYLSILYAIAEGKTKLEEIASIAGVKVTSLPYYLKDLTDLLGLLKKHTGLKRKTFYEIKDKFHNFWLRFVYKYSGIENKKIVYSLIRKNIQSFFGWSFESTIRENLLKIFKDYERVFKFYGYWRKGGERKPFEIDLVALNEKTKEILFGECKWKNRVNAKKVVKELVEKGKYVNWFNEERKEYYAVFAKSFSRKIEEFEGKRVYCFDLKDLEKVLKKV